MIIQFTDISAKNFAVHLIFPDLVNQLIVCLIKILVIDFESFKHLASFSVNTVRWYLAITLLTVKIMIVNYLWCSLKIRGPISMVSMSLFQINIL